MRLAPRNYRTLVDAERFDVNDLRLTLAPRIGTGEGSQLLPVHSERLFSAPMHFAIPDEEPIVGRKYGVNAIPAPSFPPDTVTLGTSFIIEDYVDTTPPTPGNLRVTGEVFTNDCGAKALVLERVEKAVVHEANLRSIRLIIAM